MSWGTYRCRCGRFVGRLVATYTSSLAGPGITRVMGTCRKHGRVDVTSSSEVWSEDFPMDHAA